jgi:hypothetical protein
LDPLFYVKLYTFSNFPSSAIHVLIAKRSILLFKRKLNQNLGFQKQYQNLIDSFSNSLFKSYLKTGNFRLTAFFKYVLSHRLNSGQNLGKNTGFMKNRDPLQTELFPFKRVLQNQKRKVLPVDVFKDLLPSTTINLIKQYHTLSLTTQRVLKPHKVEVDLKLIKKLVKQYPVFAYGLLFSFRQQSPREDCKPKLLDRKKAHLSRSDKPPLKQTFSGLWFTKQTGNCASATHATSAQEKRLLLGKKNQKGVMIKKKAKMNRRASLFSFASPDSYFRNKRIEKARLCYARLESQRRSGLQQIQQIDGESTWNESHDNKRVMLRSLPSRYYAQRAKSSFVPTKGRSREVFVPCYA